MLILTKEQLSRISDLSLSIKELYKEQKFKSKPNIRAEIYNTENRKINETIKPVL